MNFILRNSNLIEKLNKPSFGYYKSVCGGGVKHDSVSILMLSFLCYKYQFNCHYFQVYDYNYHYYHCFVQVGWSARIHRMHLCRVVRSLPKRVSCDPVGWGCRISRRHLCKRLIHPLTSVLDMTLNNLMVRLQ